MWLNVCTGKDCKSFFAAVEGRSGSTPLTILDDRVTVKTNLPFDMITEFIDSGAGLYCQIADNNPDLSVDDVLSVMGIVFLVEDLKSNEVALPVHVKRRIVDVMHGVNLGSCSRLTDASDVIKKLC